MDLVTAFLTASADEKNSIIADLLARRSLDGIYQLRSCSLASPARMTLMEDTVARLLIPPLMQGDSPQTQNGAAWTAAQWMLMHPEGARALVEWLSEALRDDASEQRADAAHSAVAALAKQQGGRACERLVPALIEARIADFKRRAGNDMAPGRCCPLADIDRLKPFLCVSPYEKVFNRAMALARAEAEA